MATKRKGCGFLITALVLLILGGGLATYLGMGAFSTGKEFVNDIESGHSFTTPGPTTYVAMKDNEVTVWLTGNGEDDLSRIVVHFTDTTTKTKTTFSQISGNNRMNNQHLVGTFNVKKGTTYTVETEGIADNRTMTISTVPHTAVLSIVGKGFGAIASAGACAFLALIFGIIGLVLYFTSKSKPANAAPTGPPMG